MYIVNECIVHFGGYILVVSSSSTSPPTMSSGIQKKRNYEFEFASACFAPSYLHFHFYYHVRNEIYTRKVCLETNYFEDKISSTNMRDYLSIRRSKSNITIFPKFWFFYVSYLAIPRISIVYHVNRTQIVNRTRNHLN